MPVCLPEVPKQHRRHRNVYEQLESTRKLPVVLARQRLSFASAFHDRLGVASRALTPAVVRGSPREAWSLQPPAGAVDFDVVNAVGELLLARHADVRERDDRALKEMGETGRHPVCGEGFWRRLEAEFGVLRR